MANMSRNTDLTKYDIPLPDVDERDLKGYWEGTAAGELRVQRTRDGVLQWPPRGSAVGVPDFDLEWVRVPHTGELFSWTVVGQTGLQGYSELTPYAVGTVQLDEVPIRMLGFIDEDPATLVAGERFAAKFITFNDRVTLPIWVRA